MSVLNQPSPSTVSPHAVSTLRPSACPGLLRIVAARDGGLCRIKLPGGELSAAQAEVIANASARHAAGVIEVTNRANLQLRGVSAGQEAALIAALVGAGLGPLPVDRDSDALSAATVSSADDVRNVMISPAAGRDPSALVDTRSLCAELLTLLQSEARFAALSPKFALLLDGGERLARVDHPHDVWLAASEDEDGVRFVFGLAGCPPVVLDTAGGAAKAARREACADTAVATASANQSVDADGDRPRRSLAGSDACALAAVLPSQVSALVRALLHTFLDLAAADATRMRHLLAAHSIDAVLQHAQTYVDFPLARDASLADWQRATPADARLRLGAHPQREPGTWHAGAQPPLGRLDADTLRGLALLAQQHSHGMLHLTPWQSVLLPDLRADALPAVLAGLNALGLACEPTQAITRLIACAGSSGCAKSLADTKTDALQLATRLPAAAAAAALEVHLSGCPRSCAAAHCAPYTLLAVAPGSYDLYRREHGLSGFGQCVAHQLNIEQAAALLDHLTRSHPDA